MDRWIVILIIAELAFVGWVLWLFMNHRLRREQLRAEERERILTRFSTGQELSDFLGSPGGARLFNPEARVARTVSRKLAVAVSIGVVLLCMAGAFYLMYRLGNPAGGAILVPAVWFAMSGLAVLVSAAASALLLRRTGLLPRNGDGRGTDQP